MADTRNTIETTVEIDINQAQRDIVKLNGVASDTTRDLEKRIEAKNKAVELENKVNEQSISILEAKQKQLKEEIAAGENVEKNQKELERTTQKLNRERLNEQKQISRNEKELNRLEAQQEKATQAQNAADDSLVKLREQYNALTKEYDRADSATRDALLPSMNALRDEIDEAEQASGRFQRNVGNYPDLTSAANAGFGPFVNHLKGMVTQSLAFIATPLGAILAAIVATIALFNKTIKENEELQNMWNEITYVLGQTFSELTNVITPLVEVVLKGLVSAIEFLIPLLDKFFLVLTAGVQFLTGDIEAAKQSINELTTGVTETIDENGKVIREVRKSSFESARELAQAEAELNELKRESTVLNAQLNVDAKEALRDSKDFTLSLDERLKRLNEYEQLQLQQLENERAILSAELERDQLESSLAGDDAAFKQQLADREAALINLDARIANQEREALNRRNTLISAQDKIERDSENERLRAIQKQEQEEERSRTAKEKALQMEIIRQDAIRRKDVTAQLELDKFLIEEMFRNDLEMLQNEELTEEQRSEMLKQFEEDRLAAEQDILIRRRDFELENEELTELQKEVIRQRYAEQANKLEQDLLAKRQAAYNADVKNTQLAEKAKAEARVKGSTDAISAVGALFGFSKEANLAALGIQSAKNVAQAYSSNSALPFPASLAAAGAELAASTPPIVSAVSAIKNTNVDGAPSGNGGSTPTVSTPPPPTNELAGFESIFGDNGDILNNNDIVNSASSQGGSFGASTVVLTEGELNSFNNQVSVRDNNSSF